MYDGTAVREVKGVIGTRLLMHFLITIDYAGGALVLQRPTAENLQALDSELAAAGAKVIPFWLVDTHYIVARATVNDLYPMLFFVDTGLAGKAFTAPKENLRQAGVSIS